MTPRVWNAPTNLSKFLLIKQKSRTDSDSAQSQTEFGVEVRKKGVRRQAASFPGGAEVVLGSIERILDRKKGILILTLTISFSKQVRVDADWKGTGEFGEGSDLADRAIEFGIGFEDACVGFFEDKVKNFAKVFMECVALRRTSFIPAWNYK